MTSELFHDGGNGKKASKRWQVLHLQGEQKRESKRLPFLRQAASSIDQQVGYSTVSFPYVLTNMPRS